MAHNRRQFLERLSVPLVSLASPGLAEAALVRRSANGARATSPGRSAEGANAAEVYDTLIKGGHVVDPAGGLSAVSDVAIAAGRIARVAPDLPAAGARRLVDASGRIVTPGLIDIHVHVFDAVAGVSMPADAGSLAHGVTTVVDAGSAGATTFPGFRKYIIEPSATRIYAAINISTIGLVTLNELTDLTLVDPAAAERVITANRDRIVAIKIRLTGALGAGQDLEVLRRARRASDATGVPLMVHIGGSPSPLREILASLKRGDVVTHVLREQPNGAIDAEGRVRESFLDARARGVVMDVGHGSGNFSWKTAELAAAAGWWPDTISSDLHSRNANGPVFDLATTMSKFMKLGMTLEETIARATAAPARLYPFPGGAGTLDEGAVADIAIFRLDQSRYVFTDSFKQTREGPRGLVPEATFRSGVKVA